MERKPVRFDQTGVKRNNNQKPCPEPGHKKSIIKESKTMKKIFNKIFGKMHDRNPQSRRLCRFRWQNSDRRRSRRALAHSALCIAEHHRNGQCHLEDHRTLQLRRIIGKRGNLDENNQSKDFRICGQGKTCLQILRRSEAI